MTLVTRRQALRQAIFAGAAVGSAALLAACGGSPATPPASVPAAQPTSAPIPASKPASPAPLPASKVETTPGTTPATVAIPGADLVVKPPKSKDQVTLRFHMRAGGEKSEPAIYVYRPQEWEQGTGDKVKLEPIPGGNDYAPKIEALAASGTIGDIAFSSDVHNEHSQLVKFKVLEPMDSYLKTYKVSTNEWFKAITDTITYDGVLYGLPKNGHPGDSYIFINLNMFKEAGIPEPPTYGNTFDDVRTWANKLSKGPKDKRDVYGLYCGISTVEPLTDGVRQFGSDLVAKDGVTSLVDQQGFIDWLNWNFQLVVQDRVHPFSQAIPNGNLAGLFAAEKVAMIQTARSFEFQARNAVKDKFQFTSIQYPRGPKALGWGSFIDTHAVTAASKHKEEAFSLSYALADKRFAYLVGKFQGYLTGRRDNLQDLGEYANDHFIQLQQKCTEQEMTNWRAKNLRAYEIETTFDNMLDLVWLGKRQPDQGYIADLKKAVDEVLAKPA